MKKLSQLLLLLMLASFISIDSKAQELKPGDMISGAFDSPLNNGAKNLFVAVVSAVNGASFTCSFVHSNSIYEFESYQVEEGLTKARVKTSNKGAFKPGTWFYFEAYTPTNDCGSMLKVKFNDGKVYLGETLSAGADYKVKFIHSGSIYIFSKEQVILSSGGTYPKGSKVSWECLKNIH